MSYSDWLSSVSSFIPNILNWFSSIINYCLSNYIIVTILGFSLFYSLFYLILNFIDSIKKDHKTDYDNIK